MLETNYEKQISRVLVQCKKAATKNEVRKAFPFLQARMQKLNRDELSLLIWWLSNGARWDSITSVIKELCREFDDE